MRRLAAALPFTSRFPAFFFARFLPAVLRAGRFFATFFRFFATFFRRAGAFLRAPALTRIASAAAVPPDARGRMSVATFHSNLVDSGVQHTLVLEFLL